MLANRLMMCSGAKELPIDSYVKTLLHFEGTQGSTLFTDKIGRTWLSSGGAMISTAQYKFGKSSAYFDGVDDYISTADSADFVAANNEYTIDFWFRTTRNNVYQYITGQTPYTMDTPTDYFAFELALTNNNKIGVNRRVGSTTMQFLIGTTTIAMNTWYHFEVDIVGSNIYLFLNGVLEATGTQYGNTSNASARFAIGQEGEYQYASTNRYQGWIDEFRFSNGIARHTANFVPPTVPYTK